MKRTFITDSMVRNFARHDYWSDQDTDSTDRDHKVADDEKVEFYLHNDFGEKLDPTKESVIFVNRILDRIMRHYDIDFDEISFSGNRNSINRFLAYMVEQYWHQQILKFYEDENGDYLS